MRKRFVAVWFPHLLTDWFALSDPQLRKIAFILCTPSRGRKIITACNPLALAQGIYNGMVEADARAIFPSIHSLDDRPGLAEKLLNRLAEWCIRFTPFVSLDLPNGLILDVTGCSHLWGGDEPYLKMITTRLSERGYIVRSALTDTIGASWALARYGSGPGVVASGAQQQALLSLPPEALRLDIETIQRLHKLGLRQISYFINFSSSSLRRRFGPLLVQRLRQAIGQEEEIIQPVQPVEAYQEWLPCMEPIVTAVGIEIALRRLLETICLRLQKEELGIRHAIFKCHRVDGKIIQIEIGTNRPSQNVLHLFKLFEHKISTLEPALGIELFVLEAKKVDEHSAWQEKIWHDAVGLKDIRLAELMDRFAGKFGVHSVRRFLPAEHYWPERSMKLASSLDEIAGKEWKIERPRPMQLLLQPERIEVTAPIPDYPPMLFRHKGKLHKIIKADGPERIEQEWWLQQGEHRDYYNVEDEAGQRYWLFRSGHYQASHSYQWFIHGYFA